MNTVIKAIGTFIAGMGLVYLIRPDVIRKIMQFFSKGSRLYLAAVARFVLAIVFFLGARECKVTWLIVTFGVIFLMSGLLIFMLGLEKARGIINWYLEQTNLIFRFLAIIVLGVGLIIVYAA
ncbi:MAG: hypothetical protein ABII09_02050 [Planctomycetota bacterium]